jgi:DNA-directed RNA polymerase specialized sigma24 family protein
MKPIELYADAKHCEMCGALVTDAGADPVPDYTASEVIRRLAFVADKSPDLAVVLINFIAGRSQVEIASRLHISKQAVNQKIKKAKLTIQALKITHPC